MSTQQKILKRVRRRLIKAVASEHALAIQREAEGLDEMAKVHVTTAGKLSAELQQLDKALGKTLPDALPATPMPVQAARALTPGQVLAALGVLQTLDVRHLGACKQAAESLAAGDNQAAWKQISGVAWNTAATKLAGDVLGMLKALG